MDGAFRPVLPQQFDQPFDPAPAAEVEHVALVAARPGAGRGFGACEPAEAGDEIGGLGNILAARDVNEILQPDPFPGPELWRPGITGLRLGIGEEGW